MSPEKIHPPGLMNTPLPLQAAKSLSRGIFTSISAGLFALLAAAPSESGAANANEFLVWNYDQLNNGSVDLPGRLFVPTGYDPAQSYPLVIFYHGLGEVGSNNTSQVNGNINNLLAAAKSRKFFLYAPQTPSGWNAGTIRSSMRMASNVRHEYSVDPTKVYVTGLSLGGGATWLAISLYADSMAGAVPICGVSGGPSFSPSKLVEKPIWAFHATNDPTVGVGTSQSSVNAILSARSESTINFSGVQSGEPYYTDGTKYYDRGTLRYSQYPAGGHGIWSRVYNESWMYDWLLAKTVNSLMQPGDEIVFDFGNSEIANPDSQSRTINGTPYGLHSTLGSVIPFASTTAGRSTGTWLSVVDPFAGHTTGGVSAGAPFDAGVADDGWVTSINVTEASGAGLMLIEGLLPGGVYEVEIFASVGNNDGGRGRSTRYKIGSQIRNLDAALNVSTTAVFETVSADAKGVLELRVFPNPETASRYGQINTLQLTFLQGPEGPVNAAPVVNAGPDQSLTMAVGGSVQATLTGSVSDDDLPAPPSLALEWTVLSAPSGASVVFGSPYAATTSATFDEPGEYLLRLEADDAERTATDNVVVTVNLEGGSLGGLALFSQDFGTTASTNLSSYINPTNPNIGQFDDLGTVDGTSSWRVNSAGNLEHDRSLGNAAAAGFTRHTDLGTDVQFARLEFKVGISGTSAYTDMVTWDLGAGMQTSGYDGGFSYASIGFRMSFKGLGSGNWYIRLNGNNDSPAIASDGALHAVVWYLNKSGFEKTYNGPDGFGHALPTGMSDLWLDGEKVLTNVVESAGFSANQLNEFRLRSGTSQGIVMKLDDIQYFDQDAGPPIANPYQVFLDAYFTEQEQLNAAISGDEADAENDGLENLMEYGYLLHPRESSIFEPISPSDDGTRLAVRFQRDPARTDVTLKLWGSDDLSDWTLLARSVGGEPFEDLTGGLLNLTETGMGPIDVMIEDAVLLGDPQHSARFLRLGAERPDSN